MARRTGQERYETWAWRVLARMKESTPIVSLWEYNSRDNTLRREGFLYWERFWLAQHDIGTPGMKFMRRERVKMSNEFDVSFANFNEWQREISRWYHRRQWYFTDGRLNPFKMLEWHKDKGNAPDTPQPKQPSRPKDFVGAKEVTIARQHPLDTKGWSKKTRERHEQQQREAQEHMKRLRSPF